ncbi:EAL domain-containing protein [Luteimonas sp. MC1782]|uniref:EAL domain-containing protein n=1 Tax=Luteimonas sp. MC1782 TaxID=2760305 RepID=UPI001601181A|nr:EAL domain-containing protein [Luteimonas sp. MC1782]
MTDFPHESPALEDEVQALLATLRHAEDRLQELTAGQIDAITDAGGRTILLQRAQEDVRRVDAARRTAILNSLPANIALLDGSGFIVAVNESWRQFGRSNGLKGSSADVGANYLDACQDAHGDRSDGATGIADGLLSVLERAATGFDAIYPCHSPDIDRWFQMTATPVSDDQASGVVVMHVDITDRKLHEIALQASEAEQRESTRQLSLERARLVAAQRVAKVGSWETDLATMAVLWSAESYRIHEVDPEVAVTRNDLLELVHPADKARVDIELRALLSSREPKVMRHRLLLPGGLVKFLEKRWQVDFDEDGRPLRLIGTCQDITARCLDEERIKRLNRGYLVLSQVNGLIVRVRDRDELFQGACRIAVESGGFLLAWIGRVDVVGASVVPVASAGNCPAAALPVERGFPLDDLAQPCTLTVHTREAVIVNDLASDVRFMRPGIEPANGILSLVSLPIIVGGEVVAVMSLHASDVDYFDDAEIALLTEVANDIGFAIDHIGKSETINYLAYFDALTGLANRSLFLERAAQCLRGTTAGVLALVDLERFKSINDSLGVHAGDDLLRQIATWLGRQLGDPTLLARVGPDHFAFVLTDGDRPGDAAPGLGRLIKAFHEHAFLLDGAPFRIAAKFGIATFPEDSGTAGGLLQKAESALKNAKAAGKRYLFYTQKMTDSIARQLVQENQLRHALDNREFVLHYQPKVNVDSGRVVGAEALIRWNDPRTLTMTQPAQFIPILEQTGLIIEVGRWAMRTAIDDYLRWLRAGLPAVRIAVNVSPLQLRDPAFVDDVRELISVDPLAPAGLELEITESMLMSDIEQSIETLHALRGMGVRIAIDDFGTGFSSLGYLAKLPVDTLKIDRSFIDDMGRSAQGLSLVSTMISLAHSFKLRVVAEGVETEEQSSLLKLLRCEEAQGYLHGRPLPVSEFESRFLLAGMPVR